MRKKIILSSIAFIVSLFLSLIIFVPYSQIAVKIVNNLIKENNIDVSYNKLEINLFGAEVTKLKSKNFEVDKINLSYNPISLLLKRVSFSAESDLFNANGKFASNTLNADIVASVAGIAKMYGFSGGGRVNANIKYNIDKKTGDITLDSGNISFKHPLMNIEADSLSASASAQNNIITINEAKINGKTSLDAKGNITLNLSKINHSILNISGKAGLMGMNLNFRLTGNMSAPQFTTTN